MDANLWLHMPVFALPQKRRNRNQPPLQQHILQPTLQTPGDTPGITLSHLFVPEQVQFSQRVKSRHGACMLTNTHFQMSDVLSRGS